MPITIIMIFFSHSHYTLVTAAQKNLPTRWSADVL